MAVQTRQKSRHFWRLGVGDETCDNAGGTGDHAFINLKEANWNQLGMMWKIHGNKPCRKRDADDRSKWASLGLEPKRELGQ